MRMTELFFDKGKTTASLGRNGVMQTIGIEVSDMDDIVTIHPINSKGSLGRCYIEINKDQWPGAALEAILAKDELHHLLLGIHPLIDKMLEPRLKYPKFDWEYEVQNGDTKLGYEEWLEHKMEAGK